MYTSNSSAVHMNLATSLHEDDLAGVVGGDGVGDIVGKIVVAVGATVLVAAAKAVFNAGVATQQAINNATGVPTPPPLFQ
jgi:hypothetical protein